MCLLGDNVQYRLLGEKGCNFIMNLSSGDPQPIISNVALGPSALGQHWKLLASAHHLINPQYKLSVMSSDFQILKHTSYLSLFLHPHILRPENFTLKSA